MIRIKKLDIFIVKQFGLLFAGTFFISQFVLMMQFLWKYVDELIGLGLRNLQHNIFGIEFKMPHNLNEIIRQMLIRTLDHGQIHFHVLQTIFIRLFF